MLLPSWALYTQYGAKIHIFSFFPPKLSGIFSSKITKKNQRTTFSCLSVDFALKAASNETYFSPETIAIVSLASIHSSSVGIRQTVTLESGVEMTHSSLRTLSFLHRSTQPERKIRWESLRKISRNFLIKKDANAIASRLSMKSKTFC